MCQEIVQELNDHDPEKFGPHDFKRIPASHGTVFSVRCMKVFVDFGRETGQVTAHQRKQTSME